MEFVYWGCFSIFTLHFSLHGFNKIQEEQKPYPFKVQILFISFSYLSYAHYNSWSYLLLLSDIYA